MKYINKILIMRMLLRVMKIFAKTGLIDWI